MKKNNKKNKKFGLLPRLMAWTFVAIAGAQMIATVGAFTAPEMASAQEKFDAQVAIGSKEIVFDGTTRPIAMYVKSIYTYAVGAVGILAAVMLMIGGLRWILAGGNAASISEAKSIIFAAISGMVLVMTSYLILSQINPALVNLESNVAKIKTITGSTETATTANQPRCEWVTQTANILASGCVKGDDTQCTGSKEGINYPSCCCKYDPASSNCSWSRSNCQEGYEKIDGGSYTDRNIKTCGSETENGELSYCCCKILEWNDWTFDPGISEQLPSASEDLKTLLGCMRKQLSPNQGRISSISDKLVVEEGSMDVCISDYDASRCAHTKNSCHYACGGDASRPEDSCAVDFGDEENGTAIKEAANYCGAGFVIDEGNHIHVSTKSCTRN